MSSNSILDYTKNIAESLKLATFETIQEKMPITAEFVNSNKETFNQVYNTITSIRSFIPRFGRVEDNVLYKKLNQGFTNIKADLRSGKFYHPEREDVMGSLGALSGMLGAMGGMGNDFMSELNAIFSGDFGDEDAEGGEQEPTRPEMMVTKGDALVASALFKSQSTATNCIGNLVTKLHEHGTQMNRVNFTMQLAQGQQQMQVMQTGFDLMVQGFNNIISFNDQVIKTHAENSQKFYTEVSKTLNESNAILKSIHEIQASVYRSEHSKNGALNEDDPTLGHEAIDFNSLFKNGFNFQTYKRLIDQRYQNSQIAMIYGLISALPMMLDRFIQNPLHELSKSIIGGIIGDQISHQLKKFEQTVQNAFSIGLARLYNYGKENSDSILGKIASFFGYKEKLGTMSTVDTSKYERGAVAWNGEDHMALTTVIPTYLSRIEASLTGQTERHFIYDKGKFDSGHALRNAEKYLKNDAADKATKEMQDFMKAVVKTLEFNQETTERINSSIAKLGKAMFEFGDSSVDFDKELENNFQRYGFDNINEVQYLLNMLRLMPRDVRAGMQTNISSGRAAVTKKINNLEDGMGLLARGAVDNMVTEGGKVTHGHGLDRTTVKLPGWEKLTELEDFRGNTLYDYQYMILKRLHEMGGIGGDSETGPNNNTPPTTPGGIILPNGTNSTNQIHSNSFEDVIQSNREQRRDSTKGNKRNDEIEYNMQRAIDSALHGTTLNKRELRDMYLYAKTLNDEQKKDLIKRIKEKLSTAGFENSEAILKEIKVAIKNGASDESKNTYYDSDKVSDNSFSDVDMIEYFKRAAASENLNQDEFLAKMAKEQADAIKKVLKTYHDKEVKSSSSWFDIFGGANRDISKYHQLPSNIKREDNILQQLISANDTGQIMDVVKHNMDALVDSPRLMLSSVIGKANEEVYNLLFGKNTGEKDAHGRPIRGIFQKMVVEVENQSKELGGGIKGFLSEIQKFISESFIGDWFKKETGIDVGDLSIKSAAKSMFRNSAEAMADQIRTTGNTLKQYGSEFSREIGLTDESGKIITERTFMDEYTKKKKEEYNEEDNIRAGDDQKYVAKGSSSFQGKGGIVSKGEVIIQPWKNPNYGKGTGTGSGVSVVNSTGYLDSSQLPYGSMVLNNRDLSNPYRTGASLASDQSRERSVRDAMKQGITRRASVAQIPSFAKGNKPIPTDDKMVELNYYMEYLANSNSDVTIDDLNDMVKIGPRKKEQEAYIRQKVEEKEAEGGFGDLKSKNSKVRAEAKKKRDKYKGELEFIQQKVLKMIAERSPKDKNKGRELRAKGFEKNKEGKITLGSTAKRDFAQSMVKQDELEVYNYKTLGNLRAFMESIGMGDIMPSDEEIGQKKFSKRTGPIIGMRQGILAATGTDPTKAAGLAKDAMLKEKKNIFAGGAVGALLSMVFPLGGPLMGAMVGASMNVLRKSDTFNNYVFGTEITNADGTKEREDNGLISRKTMEVFNKYMPDMKKYGTIGAIGGLITPFGPLGGAMIGAAASIVKNNASLNRIIFGKNGGLINDKRKEAIKKAFPHVALATIGTVLLGPFGLLGNAVLGAGLGMLSTTEMFKKLVLGPKGRDGIRRGGLAGVIRRQVVDPIKSTMDETKRYLGNWFKEKVFDPVSDGLKPIGRVIRGVFTQGSKKLFSTVEDYLTGKREKLPERITKLADSVFGGIRKAGGLGQWITESAIGGLVAGGAKLVKKVGEGSEEFAVRHGLTGGYDAKEMSEVLKRMGDKSDRSNAVNAMANMNEDQIAQLHEAMTLFDKNTKGAEKHYQRQQDELANFTKSDIYKLSEQNKDNGEEGNAIARLSMNVNSDLYNKLLSMKDDDARKKFLDEFANNTDISKENRKKITDMIMKDLEEYGGIASKKQTALSGNYQNDFLKTIRDTLQLDPTMGAQQMREFIDKNGIYDILDTTHNKNLDIKHMREQEERLKNPDEEKESEETVAVTELQHVEVLDRNTEATNQLTECIKQLTEMYKYLYGEINKEDLKYSGNIKSAEDQEALDAVNAAKVTSIKNQTEEALENAEDRKTTTQEFIQRRDLSGAFNSASEAITQGVSKSVDKVLKSPEKFKDKLIRAVTDVKSGDKEISISGALKGAAKGAFAGGALSQLLDIDLSGSGFAGAIAFGAANGAGKIKDKSDDFLKTHGLAEDYNYALYVTEHYGKDHYSNITEKEFEYAKFLLSAIEDARKAMTNGVDPKDYKTGDTPYGEAQRTINNIINQGFKIPFTDIKVNTPDDIKKFHNKETMKKIAAASISDKRNMIQQAARFGTEWEKQIRALIEASEAEYGSKDESIKMDNITPPKEDDNKNPPDNPPAQAARGTGFFVPSYAEGSWFSGLKSTWGDMKKAAKEGGKKAAKDHYEKTKTSAKDHFNNLFGIENKSSTNSESINEARALPAFPIVPTGDASGAASSDPNMKEDEHGRKVKEVPTAEGDIITYGESSADGSHVRLATKDNLQAEKKLEEKRDLSRRSTRALEQIAYKLGAMRAGAGEKVEEGKGLLDDLLDLAKTPFKWIGGALSSAAGVLGAFLMKSLITPITDRIKKLGTKFTGWVSKKFTDAGKFMSQQLTKATAGLKNIIPGTVRAIATAVLSLLKKNRIIAGLLTGVGLLTGKKIYDAFDTDEGLQEEVDGYSGKKNGVGAMTPAEQKIVKEMKDRGQSDEEITYFLNHRRREQRARGEQDEVKGDKWQEKKELFASVSGVGGALLGGLLGGKHKLLGAALGGALGSGAGDLAKGESVSAWGLAKDTATSLLMGKALGWGVDKVKGAFRSEYDAARAAQQAGDARTNGANRNGFRGRDGRLIRRLDQSNGSLRNGRIVGAGSDRLAQQAAQNAAGGGSGLLGKAWGLLKSHKRLGGLAALGTLGSYYLLSGDDDKQAQAAPYGYPPIPPSGGYPPQVPPGYVPNDNREEEKNKAWDSVKGLAGSVAGGMIGSRLLSRFGPIGSAIGMGLGTATAGAISSGNTDNMLSNTAMYGGVNYLFNKLRGNTGTPTPTPVNNGGATRFGNMVAGTLNGASRAAESISNVKDKIKASAETGKIAEIMSKIKGLFDSFVNGVGKLLPSGGTERLKGMLDNILSKLKPEMLKQHLPKLSKCLAGALIGGPLALGILGVGFAAKAFYDGYGKEMASKVFNMAVDKITTGMQIVSGVVHALVNFNPIISIIVDLALGGVKGLLTLAIKYIGPLVGLDESIVNAANKADEEKQESTSEEKKDKDHGGAGGKFEEEKKDVTVDHAKSLSITKDTSLIANMTKEELKENKTVIKNKIIDIINQIKFVITKYIDTNAKNAMENLGLKIASEAVDNTSNFQNGIAKLNIKNNKGFVSSNVMNFKVTDTSINIAYISGSAIAHKILGIPAGSATNNMKTISAIINTILLNIPFLRGFIPDKTLKLIVIDIIGSAIGVSKEDINKLKKITEDKAKKSNMVSNQITEDKAKSSQGGKSNSSVSVNTSGKSDTTVKQQTQTQTKDADKDKPSETKSTWESVKETASDAWEKTKAIASSAVDKVKSAGSAVYNYITGNGKGKYGENKYVNKYGTGLYLQSDPRFGDRKQENCLSFAEANLYGEDPRQFMLEHQKSGDKVNNDGTKPEGAIKSAKKRGRDAFILSGKSKSQLEKLSNKGYKFIIEGQNRKGINPNDPFGVGKHYVGYDYRTGITKDSQPKNESQPYEVYKPENMLKSATKVIAIGPKNNMRATNIIRSPHGKRSTNLFRAAHRVAEYGKSKYGKGMTEDEFIKKTMAIAVKVAQLIGSSHPELIFAQMMHETGGPAYVLGKGNNLPTDYHNYGGIKWYSFMGEEHKSDVYCPAGEAGGSVPYAKFKDDDEYAQKKFDWVFKSYKDELAKATTVEEFATVLKNHDYFENDLSEYVAGMNSFLKQYATQLKDIGNITVSPSSSSGSTSGAAASNSNKPLGFFGALAKLASAFDPFNFDFSNPTQTISNAINGFKNSVTGGGSNSSASGEKVDVPASGNAAEAMKEAIKKDITSPYGPRSSGYHHGVDYGAEEGTKIPALMDATVDDIGSESGGYGNYVVLKDKKGNYHISGHLSDNSIVSKGAQVSKGQVIGLSGNTGHSTGPHLHYGIYSNPNCAGGTGAMDPAGYSLNGLGKYGMGKYNNEPDKYQIKPIYKQLMKPKYGSTGGTDDIKGYEESTLKPKKHGKSKFTKALFGLGKFLPGLSKYGMGTAEEEEKLKGMMKIAAITAQKVGSKHPELFFVQMIHETGGPAKLLKDNQMMGFDDHNYAGFTWYEGMGEEYKGWKRPANEGGYYAKFKSDEEFAEKWYDKVFKKYASDLAKAETPEQFARVLKANGYYTSDEADYAAGLKAHLEQYKDKIKEIGNIDVSSSTSSSGSSTSSSAPSKPLGFFGLIANLASALDPFGSGFEGFGSTNTTNNNTNTSNAGSLSGNIQAASAWAESKVGTTGYGNNGCTEFVKRYLKEAKSPLGDLMEKGEEYDGHSLMWVPSLWKWAKANNVWKDASQGGVQGDVALINTDSDSSDPDHVVIATGDGGYWGNSSSTNTIKKSNLANDYGSENIFGYINTGGGGQGTVSSGSATRSKSEIVGDAGSTSAGQGKYGKGKFANFLSKFGTGKFLPGLSKYGMGPQERQFIWEWLRNPQKGGLNNAAAAGIMGNIQQESDFNPHAYQDAADQAEAPPPAGEGEHGYGICQWTGSRAANLIEFAKSKGKSSGDLETQLEFMMKEAVESGCWSGMLNQSSPTEAANYWAKKFERCGEPGQRVQYAQQIYDTDGKGEAGQTTYNGQAPASGNAASSGASNNPLVSRLMGKINQFLSNNPRFNQMMTFLFGANPFASLFGSSGGGSTGTNTNTATSATGGAVAPSQYAAKVVEAARSHVGKPYVMGANGPDAYDCSSHAQTSYSAAGLEVPRTADTQYEFFKGKNALVNLEQGQPGDMIFFANTYPTDTENNNGITHVGIVSKPGGKGTIEMIHASSSQGVVECVVPKWHLDRLPSGRPCIGSLSLAFGGATSSTTTSTSSTSNDDGKNENHGSGGGSFGSGKEDFDTNPEKRIPEQSYRIPWDNDEITLKKTPEFIPTNSFGMGKGEEDEDDTEKETTVTDSGPHDMNYYINKGMNIDEAFEAAAKEQKARRKTRQNKMSNSSISAENNKSLTNFFNIQEEAQAALDRQNGVSVKEKSDKKKKSKDDTVAPNGKQYETNDIQYLLNQGYTLKGAIDLLSKDKKYTEKNEEDKYKAPNGKKYEENDIKYLLNQGYTEKQALEILSKDKKYAKKYKTKKAPNGEEYEDNDIQYLLDQGYTLDKAIEILSKEKKYTEKKKDDTNRKKRRRRRRRLSDYDDDYYYEEDDKPRRKSNSDSIEEAVENKRRRRRRRVSDYDKDYEDEEKEDIKPRRRRRRIRRISDYDRDYDDDYYYEEEDIKPRRRRRRRRLSDYDDDYYYEEDDKPRRKSNSDSIEDAIEKSIAPNGKEYEDNDIQYLLDQGYSLKDALEILSKDEKYAKKYKTKKAPNGEEYEDNDIQYLLDQGYTLEQAIEILSKEKKYTEKKKDDTNKKKRRRRRRISDYDDEYYYYEEETKPRRKYNSDSIKDAIEKKNDYEEKEEDTTEEEKKVIKNDIHQQMQASKMYYNGVTNFGLENAKYNPDLKIPSEYIFDSKHDTDEIAYAKGCAARAFSNGEDPKKAYDEALEWYYRETGIDSRKKDTESKENKKRIRKYNSDSIEDAIEKKRRRRRRISDYDKDYDDEYYYEEEDTKPRRRRRRRISDYDDEYYYEEDIKPRRRRRRRRRYNSDSIEDAVKKKKSKDLFTAPNGKKYDIDEIQDLIDKGHTLQEATAILAKSDKYKDEEDKTNKAPNGKEYEENDIQYLLNQGYTKDKAIELLSKDKKYAKKYKTNKAPNGEEYEDNDIQYLLDQGCTLEQAIEILSKDKKYTEKKKTKSDSINNAIKKSVAPNGKQYEENDIQYLLNQGCNIKEAIEILSKDKKYTEKPKSKSDSINAASDKKSKTSAKISLGKDGTEFDIDDIQKLLDEGYTLEEAKEILSEKAKYKIKKKKKSNSDSIEDAKSKNKKKKKKNKEEDIEEDEMIAPNGKTYDEKDIQELVDEGKTIDEAIDILSNEPKYTDSGPHDMNYYINKGMNIDEAFEAAAKEQQARRKGFSQKAEKPPKDFDKFLEIQEEAQAMLDEEYEEDDEEEETTNKSKSSTLAPNGEQYEENDIQYLLNQGYSLKDALELLSNHDKYKKKKTTKDDENSTKKKKGRKLKLGEDELEYDMAELQELLDEGYTLTEAMDILSEDPKYNTDKRNIKLKREKERKSNAIKTEQEKLKRRRNRLKAINKQKEKFEEIDIQTLLDQGYTFREALDELSTRPNTKKEKKKKSRRESNHDFITIGDSKYNYDDLQDALDHGFSLREALNIVTKEKDNKSNSDSINEAKKKYKTKSKAPNGKEYEDNDIQYLLDNGYTLQQAEEELAKSDKYKKDKYTAPNGEKYENNDIQYLLDNGYTLEQALDELSKSDKYTKPKSKSDSIEETKKKKETNGILQQIQASKMYYNGVTNYGLENAKYNPDKKVPSEYIFNSKEDTDDIAYAKGCAARAFGNGEDPKKAYDEAMKQYHDELKKMEEEYNLKEKDKTNINSAKVKPNHIDHTTKEIQNRNDKILLNDNASIITEEPDIKINDTNTKVTETNKNNQTNDNLIANLTTIAAMVKEQSRTNDILSAILSIIKVAIENIGKPTDQQNIKDSSTENKFAPKTNIGNNNGISGLEAVAGSLAGPIKTILSTLGGGSKFGMGDKLLGNMGNRDNANGSVTSIINAMNAIVQR